MTVPFKAAKASNVSMAREGSGAIRGLQFGVAAAAVRWLVMNCAA